MPKFHKAIQDIAIKASVNGGPTIQDVLTALCASHEDSLEAAKLLAEDVTQNREHNESDHREIVAKIDEETKATRAVVTQVMDAHMEWTRGSGGPLARLTLIEKAAAWRSPRRLDDPSDSEFTETRESAYPTDEQRSLSQIVVGWSLFKKGLAVAATALIIGLVGLGVTYVSSYWAADRAEKAGIQTEKTSIPQPAVTITVSPSPEGV